MSEKQTPEIVIARGSHIVGEDNFNSLEEAIRRKTDGDPGLVILEHSTQLPEDFNDKTIAWQKRGYSPQEALILATRKTPFGANVDREEISNVIDHLRKKEDASGHIVRQLDAVTRNGNNFVAFERSPVTSGEFSESKSLRQKMYEDARKLLLDGKTKEAAEVWEKRTDESIKLLEKRDKALVQETKRLLEMTGVETAIIGIGTEHAALKEEFKDSGLMAVDVTREDEENFIPGGSTLVKKRAGQILSQEDLTRELVTTVISRTPTIVDKIKRPYDRYRTISEVLDDTEIEEILGADKEVSQKKLKDIIERVKDYGSFAGRDIPPPIIKEAQQPTRTREEQQDEPREWTPRRPPPRHPGYEESYPAPSPNESVETIVPVPQHTPETTPQRTTQSENTQKPVEQTPQQSEPQQPRETPEQRRARHNRIRAEQTYTHPVTGVPMSYGEMVGYNRAVEQTQKANEEYRRKQQAEADYWKGVNKRAEANAKPMTNTEAFRYIRRDTTQNTPEEEIELKKRWEQTPFSTRVAAIVEALAIEYGPKVAKAAVLGVIASIYGTALGVRAVGREVDKYFNNPDNVEKPKEPSKKQEDKPTAEQQAEEQRTLRKKWNETKRALDAADPSLTYENNYPRTAEGLARMLQDLADLNEARQLAQQHGIDTEGNIFTGAPSAKNLRKLVKQKQEDNATQAAANRKKLESEAKKHGISPWSMWGGDKTDTQLQDEIAQKQAAQAEALVKAQEEQQKKQQRYLEEQQALQQEEERKKKPPQYTSTPQQETPTKETPTVSTPNKPAPRSQADITEPREKPKPTEPQDTTAQEPKGRGSTFNANPKDFDEATRNFDSATERRGDQPKQEQTQQRQKPDNTQSAKEDRYSGNRPETFPDIPMSQRIEELDKLAREAAQRDPNTVLDRPFTVRDRGGDRIPIRTAKDAIQTTQDILSGARQGNAASAEAALNKMEGLIRSNLEAVNQNPSLPEEDLNAIHSTAPDPRRQVTRNDEEAGAALRNILSPTKGQS